MKKILVYDGSFDGFLTAVFTIYEEKIPLASIQTKRIASENFFDTLETVFTDRIKAERVWKGICRYFSSEGRQQLYKAFLSEITGVEDTMLYVIRKAFSAKQKIESNFTDPHILKISKIAKSVSREKHRMDAFVRFRLTKDGVYLSTIEPDFNVLPLNAKHFKNRYADQKWIIYDLKRNYGLYYDLENVNTIEIELTDDVNLNSNKQVFFTSEEIEYEELWKNYFKSTNIVSRKNTKLHLRHVPKRYWKYLSEKAY
ncbi:TIGR03915 family putative DNA repair protein [Ulvibacter antarcticus]|uniref:Putative DNA metabolism protein n=1 Tax=Ulvibacter antarcticus TaxID=442714 RepID=A0A3L9YI55_9FLAO|nr:TIGR03915 family putative DNA repair protein [Ulvibacter antarcticus]RMA57598.1 putative DNA metabolism protein [Ulvibacter antarcticus]